MFNPESFGKLFNRKISHVMFYPTRSFFQGVMKSRKPAHLFSISCIQWIWGKMSYSSNYSIWNMITEYITRIKCIISGFNYKALGQVTLFSEESEVYFGATKVNFKLWRFCWNNYIFDKNEMHNKERKEFLQSMLSEIILVPKCCREKYA